MKSKHHKNNHSMLQEINVLKGNKQIRVFLKKYYRIPIAMLIVGIIVEAFTTYKKVSHITKMFKYIRFIDAVSH